MILLLFACIGVVHGTEVALCTDASDQISPDVYGHYVVWEDHRGSLPRIYLYDIDTGRATVIPSPLEVMSQYAPAIFGDNVVYISSKAGGRYEVRLYSISAGTSAVIRDSAYLLETPDVYSSGGDAVDVVWTEYTPNETYPVANSDIYRYTRTPMGVMTTTRISTGLYESAPRISENAVVWMHRVGSPDETTYHDNYLVYAQTGSNPAQLISTTTTGEKNYHPDVQSGRVVWQDSPTADQEFSTVLLSQLPPLSGDPGTLQPAATPEPGRIHSYRQPAIWGSSVVYVDADTSTSEHSLRLMDLGSDLDYYLSPSTHVSTPRIQGNTVVWQDNRAGNWDIYMARTGPTPVTGCTVIDQPGYYALSADIIDSACPVSIDIRCSNVLFDGQNHLVDGRDSAGTTGIRIQASPTCALTNVEVRNIRLTDWATGFSGVFCSDCTLSAVSVSSGGEGFSFMIDCHDNAISACTASENSGTGISVIDDCSVILTASTVANNGGSGVYGDTSGVVCNDSLIAGNGFGASGGDGFTFARAGGNFYNNTIRDNRGAGLYFNHNVGGTIAGNTITGNAVGISDNNFVGEGGGRTIYNNLFNNTLNADVNLPEIWSVTERLGPNIVGGPSIGGNYWAQPNGNGFSQTHSDLDNDGFCDASYTVTPASFDLAASVDQLPLSETFHVKMIPGYLMPHDLDLNGTYEDVNGNGRPDFADVVLYFNQMTWVAANEPLAAFDYNGNGRIDFADIVWLFNNL